MPFFKESQIEAAKKQVNAATPVEPAPVLVTPVTPTETIVIESAPIEPTTEPAKKGKLNMDDATTGTTDNTILDNETHYCRVDLLKHLDDDNEFKKLCLSVSRACDLPPSTVFLTGLGVFSSIACRQWRVNYPRSGTLPIGLYVIAEQRSGTSKSRCLGIFQKPFFDVHFDDIRAIKESLKGLEAKEKDKLQTDLLKLQSFVTNPTPEALEESLNYSKGFFSAVSSEKGMINTLLGLSYGDSKSNNNDLLLNGFNGDFISSIRLTREGFRGYVAGGMVLFAQDGGVESVLKSSNGSGLAERMLMIAEPSRLGFREDFNNSRHIDDDCVNDYEKICKKITADSFTEPKDYRDLLSLTIDREGWRLINNFRNEIEPHLRPAGRYSHASLCGAASKVDMQIMKISANLQLLRGVKGDTELGNYPIDNDLVEASIKIMADLLEAHLLMLKDKGLVGAKAEYNAILSIFEKDSRAKTFEQIRKSRITVEPFKSHTGNKSELVKTTLRDMVTDGILSATALDGGGLSYELIR